MEAGRRADPIARFRAWLEGKHLLDAAHAERISAAVEAEVEDAVQFAESSPPPEPAEALEDLFAYYPWRD